MSPFILSLSIQSGSESVRIDDLGTLRNLTHGNVLLVEDWVIHGHAIDLVKTHLPKIVNIKTSALVKHPESNYPIDYVGTASLKQIYFPYD
jgi:hypothetical protein